MERVALSTLQLYELEILTQYALYRAFGTQLAHSW